MHAVAWAPAAALTDSRLAAPKDALQERRLASARAFAGPPVSRRSCETTSGRLPVLTRGRFLASQSRWISRRAGNNTDAHVGQSQQLMDTFDRPCGAGPRQVLVGPCAPEQLISALRTAVLLLRPTLGVGCVYRYSSGSRACGTPAAAPTLCTASSIFAMNGSPMRAAMAGYRTVLSPRPIRIMARTAAAVSLG